MLLPIKMFRRVGRWCKWFFGRMHRTPKAFMIIRPSLRKCRQCVFGKRKIFLGSEVKPVLLQNAKGEYDWVEKKTIEKFDEIVIWVIEFIFRGESCVWYSSTFVIFVRRSIDFQKAPLYAYLRLYTWTNHAVSKKFCPKHRWEHHGLVYGSRRRSEGSSKFASLFGWQPSLLLGFD